MRTLTLFLFLAFATATSAQTRINYGSLKWSDDGRQILFSSIEVKPDWSNYSPFNWRLYLYDLRRDELILVDKAAQYGAFSPDGDKVVYSKNTGVSWDLYIKDLSSGSKRKVTDTPQSETAPDWSPDGRMIVFTRNLKKDVSGIYSMDTEGRNVRNLSRNDRFECHNPEFSPDGEMVVYYMDRGDKKDQVYVMELRTGFARNVTRDNHHNYFPGWFGGGFLMYTRGKDELCLKEVEGGPALPIEGIQSYYAKYNAAQKQIAYINREDQSIYVQKLKGRPGKLKAGKAERVVSPEVLEGK
ncbi:MAG: PD40 domain-containing protein [Lewinellaceae bacterium]|nr:PD40 domain-containing protein [Phaeodactylibacter sp.]MCB9035769.1 PD40 domain-containing protein [Lewinellaceae bacterium]